MSSGKAWMMGLADQAKKQKSLMDDLAAKHKRIMKARKAFMAIFGTDVKTYYKDIYTEFDIIAFDEYLQTKDEQYRKMNAGEMGDDVDCSMQHHIQAKYGDEAAKMVESFI